MASVDPTIATTVAIANTTKTAWDALHIAYANKSQTRIFNLRDRLTRLTKDSQPIIEYLQHIRSISDELSIAGAPITNSELIVKILSVLGPEFREISTAIRARDSTISYEELYEKLLDHELFLLHEESKQAPNQITVVAATSNRSVHSNSRNTRQPNNGAPTIALLHPISVDLPLPPTLMMAPTDSWIVDSGASHHITAEPHNLQAYNGMEHVSMGDGTPLVHDQSRDGLYEWPTSPSVPSPQAHATSSNSSSIIT
ncbi:uncharacterized protein LOC125855973 [Solanum stenotomum]|uniref:uncharacterized protein LOC125855973 n=1 Tax=Solanum stenotomum TaxID=172797 RepID=UPI0020D11ADD|nr:uncharacterized protein LOC125855973 [Solanum stenotomum]